MQGVEFLKKHKVEFNTLTVVNRANSRHPLEVYRFLKFHGKVERSMCGIVTKCLPVESQSMAVL